jgi:hypothetical protein
MGDKITASEAGRLGAAAAHAKRKPGENSRFGSKGAKLRWGAIRKRPCPVCDLPLGPTRMAKRDGQLVHETCVGGASEIDTAP